MVLKIVRMNTLTLSKNKLDFWNGCGNLYHKQCKEKVLKMLKDGKFEEFAPDWLNYRTIILTKEPE